MGILFYFPRKNFWCCNRSTIVVDYRVHSVALSGLWNKINARDPGVALLRRFTPGY